MEERESHALEATGSRERMIWMIGATWHKRKGDHEIQNHDKGKGRKGESQVG